MYKKKKTRSKSRSGKGWLLTYFLVIIAVLATIRLVIYLNHKHDQNLMLKDLDRAGVLLDEIAEGIKNSSFDLRPERLNYCFRSPKKIGEGLIYCGQSIELSEINLPKETTEKRTIFLQNYLKDLDIMSFIQRESTGRIVNFISETKIEGGNCTASIIKSTDGKDYDFSLVCANGHYDRFVYPSLSTYH